MTGFSLFLLPDRTHIKELDFDRTSRSCYHDTEVTQMRWNKLKLRRSFWLGLLLMAMLGIGVLSVGQVRGDDP